MRPERLKEPIYPNTSFQNLNSVSQAQCGQIKGKGAGKKKKKDKIPLMWGNV